MRNKRPIPDSYWVITSALDDGYFLAGEYPGARRPEAAREKILRLLDAGITFFIDLTTEEDGLAPYAALLQELAAERSVAAGYRRLPIRDLDVPTPEKMAAILDVIDAKLAEGQQIYLHCWGGIGRTGTVVGCYLVRHGRSPESAAGAAEVAA